MRARIRRIVRVVLVVCTSTILLATTLLIAAVLALQTDWARDALRDRMESELGSLLLGRVRIGSLRGNIVQSMVIGDVEISDASGAPALTIGSLQVDYNLLSLFRKRISVEHLNISDVHVNATRNADGAINLATLLRPAPDTEATFDWRVAVDAISIAGSAEIFGSALPSVTAEASHFVVNHGDISARDVSVQADDSSILVPAIEWHQQSQTPYIAGRATIAPKLLELLVDKTVTTDVLELEFLAHRPLEDGLVEIRLDASAGTQRVHAAAKVDINSQFASGNIDIAHLHLRPLIDSTDLTMDMQFSLRGFSLESAEASLEVQATGDVYGQALDALRVQSELHRGLVSVQAKLRAQDAEASAQALLRIDQDPVVIVSSSLSAESPDLRAALGRWLDLEGAVKVIGSAKGPITAPEFQLELDSPALAFQGQRLGPIRTSVTGTRVGDGLRVQTRNARLGPARISGQAEISSTTLRTEITDLQVDLSKLPVPLVGDARLAGTVRLHGHLQKDGALWNADLSFEGSRLSLAAGLAAIRTRGHLLLEDGRLRTELRAWGPKEQIVQLQARARIPRDQSGALAWSEMDESSLLHLDLSYQNIELTTIASAMHFDGLQAGVSNGHLRYRGNRQADLQAELKGIRAQDLLLRDVDATLDLRLRRNALSVRGQADLGRLGKLSADMEAEPPQRLFAIGQWKRRGTRQIRKLDLQLRDSRVARQDLRSLGVSWPFANEQIGSIEGELTLEEGRRAHIAMRATQLQSELWQGEATSNLEIAIDNGKATMQGSFSASDALELQVQAETRAGGDLLTQKAWQGLSRQWLRSASLHAKGSFTAPLVARLGLPAPVDGSAELTLIVEDRAEKARLQGRFQGRIYPTDSRESQLTTDLQIDREQTHITASFSDGSKANAEVMATLSAGSQQVWREGLAPLASAHLMAEMRVQKMSLARIASALHREEEVSGLISASATATGSVQDPTIRAQLWSGAVQFRGARIPRLVVSGRFTLEESELSLRTRSGQGQAAEALRVQATLMTPPGEPLKINAKLTLRDFSLHPFAALVPDLSGSASGEILATGPLPSPAFTGHLVVDDLSLRELGPLRDLRSGHLDARSTANRAKIQLSTRSGGGELSLKSDIELSPNGISGLQAELSSRSLPIRAGSMSLTVNSKMQVRSKRNEEGALVTHIDVGDSLLLLPKQSDSPDLYPIGKLEDVVIVSDGVVEGTEPSPSLLPNLIAYINAPNTILVRSPEGRAVVSVKLKLRTGSELILTGSAQSQEGIFELFGNRYRIERAWAFFDGDPKDPQLDVRLVREFPAFALGIELSGSAEKPELRLTSDPPIYDEAQLLAFVLGADPNEPETGDRSLGGRAAGLAAGVLAGQLQSLVTRRLPLDVLRVELGDDATALTKLTLGKWITQKLFVAYRHRFEAKPEENIEEAVIEYRFWRRWLLEGYFGDKAAAGADLLWVWRF